MKIVKYRIVYMRSVSDWCCSSEENFRNVMKRLPSNVRWVECKIYETQNFLEGKYKLIDAWDWIRTNEFLKVPDDPANFRKTRNGVWCHKSLKKLT